jgi:dTDP-4-amino-4,6-dideoxygalactose transaminase
MASVIGTFVPTYQGLSARDLVRAHRAKDPVVERVEHRGAFPFNIADRLPFYRARNAIYHLFRALLETNPGLSVLAPDYNSGNEILAMRAAGATVRYCPVRSDMTLDPNDVERYCRIHRPDLLYVIHYAGWPQDMTALVEICRHRGMLLVEDCALALLSEQDGRPLGTFGDWSVFCLYKTLPLPNGALLIQNGPRLEALERLRMRHAGSASVLGRTAELVVQRIRGRANGVGAALQLVKRGMGRAAGALDVHRANVGDIGFNLSEVDLAMSPVSKRLLAGMDLAAIRRRRVENYVQLARSLSPHVVQLFPELPAGVCPLFFPIVVSDKHAAAEALRARGVDALEFWNESVEPGGHDMAAGARYLRRHVLELPIHQDLTPRHIEHVARHVSALAQKVAA